MNIVLATGIFPPEIGGPATYVSSLADELRKRNVTVTVLTYGKKKGKETLPNGVKLIRVGLGLPILRWRNYAKVLRDVGEQADIVYAFSSVSCGVPILWAGLKHPRKILRLGGDFLWERYTDRGGDLGLRKWYEQKPRFQTWMNGLLRRFEHVVFSTEFQERMYETFYERLPLHSVIENAVPSGAPVKHERHSPFRMMFLGRFVGFKNLFSLVDAMKELPDAELTFVGSGPLKEVLEKRAREAGVFVRVHFRPPTHGADKEALFREQDLLIIPSRTEISPNAALEARAAGLPVLLTEETGLSHTLSDGISLRPLATSREIIQGVKEIMANYPVFADRAAEPAAHRGWSEVCDEHVSLFRSLL